MPGFAKPPTLRPVPLPKKGAKTPSRKTSKPSRTKGGKPVAPPKATPESDSQPREPSGRFGPRVPGTAEEEAERQDRKDLRRLVKFEAVIESVEKFRVPLRTGGRGSDSSPDEIIDALIADIRTRLLFDDNPRLVQKLAPVEKQPLGARIAMGRDPATSIQRRYGGAGFGSGELEVPVRLEVPAPTFYDALAKASRRAKGKRAMKKPAGKKR